MARPFYVIGHNTNSIEEIRGGLANGLNAFEVDIQDDDDGNLFVSHDPVRPTTKGFHLPPRLPQFFQELAELARSPEGANIALLMLDCKVTRGAQARTLLDVVHAHFPDGADPALPIIYSVPKIDAAATFFPSIRDQLRARELLMIDEEDEIKAVSRFFFTVLHAGRAGYGNGSAVFSQPNLPSQMDAAVAFRAIENVCFVYAWVVNNASDLQEFVRIGVDGILVDELSARAQVRFVETMLAGSVRMATRADDPFAPDTSLVVQVLTSDAPNAGTDAVVTFTLEPANGAPRISRSVNGFSHRRFEANTLSFVTFRGVELRPQDIRAVTVSHDGSGNAPDWRLDALVLRRRGAPERRIEFDSEIEAGTPITRLVPPA